MEAERQWWARASFSASAWCLPALALAILLRRDLDLVVFFLGLMLLAYGAEAAGLFQWLAWHAIRTARGSPRRMLLTMTAVGIVVAAVFSNDAATLLLTPAVLAATTDTNEAQLLFVLTSTFIADFASVILPFSNPVNSLAVEHFHIGLGEYLVRLTIPGLVAAGAALAMCLWLFRRPLERAPRIAIGLEPATNPARRGGVVAVVSLGVAYIVFALNQWPLGLVTLSVGASLAVLVTWQFRWSERRVWSGVSWQALGLIVGLLIVVRALDTTGVSDRLAQVSTGRGTLVPAVVLLGTAVAVGIASNVMNNWPAMLLAVSVLDAGRLAGSTHAATYGAVLGADIGSKFTLVGSLATVLWLTLLQQQGRPVSLQEYTRATLVVTPVVLGSALLIAVLLLRA